jgi:DNA-binding transcriptional regulator YiaG
MRINMTKLVLQEFEVAIPSPDGESIAEHISVNVPVEWDEELQQYVLSPDAQRIIEDTKARYMGLLLPEQLKELRGRLRLTQKEIGELLQVGEKSWCRWESGKQRPSRSVNLLLRALYDGEVSIEYLERVRRPVSLWANMVALCESHHSLERSVIRMDETVLGEYSLRIAERHNNTAAANQELAKVA